MALSETAHLAVQLDLQGNLTSGLAKAEAGLTRFSGVAGKVGGALSHAKTAIGGLIAGPLGLIGLTGGLLTAGGAIKSTLDHMNDLAFGTEKLTALTGDSAQTISTLIAASEKYGVTLDKLTVTAGFYEKAVGKLEVTGKLTDFQKEFGVALTDNTGKALGFSEALLSVADVFATSTDEAKNATLAAALFGRSYTGLIPVLALGRQGILDLEKEAASMGLQLSDKNVADFAKYRAALRSSQEAISGLEVAIGEDLLPTITELAQGVSKFVSEHKTDIVTFFHNAVQVAKDAASTIGGVASAVGAFWNSIPAPVRDILTKGLLADRTVKFLFGFSPVENLFGQFFARGSSPANPMYVSGGGIGGAAGGIGLVGGALVAVSIVGIAAEVADALSFRQNRQILADQYKLTNAQALALQVEAHGGLQSYDTRSRAGIAQQFINENTTYSGSLAAAHALQKLSLTVADLTKTMDAGDKSFRDVTDAVSSVAGKDYALTAGRDTLLKEIRDASAARYGGTGLGPAAVEATYERRLLFATERIMDNGQSTDDKIAQLKDIEDTLVSDGDKKTRARIDTLITKLQSQKPPTVNVTIPIRVIQDGYLVSTTTRIVNGTPTTVVSRN